MGERGQSVEETGRRHREADARLLGKKTGDGGSVTGILLMPEREDANTLGLRHAAEIRDRDAGHAVDRLDAVELERLDDEVKAVRQVLRCRINRFRRFCFYCCICHGSPP